MGISTLFMPQDSYGLIYDKSVVLKPLDQNFNHSEAILGLLNLSIGYQIPVKKSFTIMVEPYIQLPFKDIGGGGTKMSSIGIQTGIRYSFPRSKK